ncbi:hypothetical protein ACS0TY_006942 [Phlomoides rotata]
MDQTQKFMFSSHDRNLDPVVASAASKSSPVKGSTSMLNFGAVGGVKRPGDSFFQCFDQEEIGDEYLDEYFSQPEKKKRLTEKQVQFLERSFEADNKLEPEKKMQLAKELGMEPRQIAVWFQNRRARWKTRQLETDYDKLHASYKSLKINHDNLLKENERLKSEVFHLKRNGISRDTEETNLRLCDIEEGPEAEEAIARLVSEDEESKVSSMAFKNDEQNSAKSDVTNVESPRLTDGIHSSVLESGNSSRAFEPDQSGLSHNGEDNLIEELLLPDCIFPKIEIAHCHTPVSSFYYGFPVEDHAFGFWSS